MDVTLHVHNSAALGAAAPDPQGALVPPKLTALSFDTGLPGGFLTCRFTTQIPNPANWDVELGRTVAVRQSTDVVWQGQIEDIAYKRLSNDGYQADVTALGAWQRLQSETFSASYTTATTGDTILEAALASVAGIGTDYTQIINPGVNLNTITFENARVSDVVDEISKYGDTNNNAYFFAIWETPKSGTDTTAPRGQFWARSLSTPTWRVRVSEIDFAFTRSLGEVYNAVWGRYQSGSTTAVTATTTDTTSITNYGRREYEVDLETQASAAAVYARDRFLAQYKDPRPMLSPFRLRGYCRDGGGARRPLSYVRAGDVMQIEDWLDGVSFAVGATSYDAIRDELQVSPEERPRILDNQI